MSPATASATTTSSSASKSRTNLVANRKGYWKNWRVYPEFIEGPPRRTRKVVMALKDKRDVWIEMSIRETWTQCHFAEIAYSHINSKAQITTDLVFSSIHSFLSHCAMVSKMLKAKDERSPSVSIGDILCISKNSVVHKRGFRNNLEHYDKELKKWIEKYPVDINIGTYNVGPKSAIEGNVVFISHYDLNTDNLTFVDEDFNLGELLSEVSRIKNICDNWVKSMEAGLISPPF